MIGRLRRLLSRTRGDAQPRPQRGRREATEAQRRIEAARRRLRAAIPPRED